MTLQTYLFFDGNCAEAFDFYRSVFGGEFSSRSTYADAPADMGIRDDDRNKIMHVSLPIGDSVLMGSDHCEGAGPPLSHGTNFAVSYTPANRKEAERVFAKLLEGGEVSMPLQDTFWGSYFGQGTDRFGIAWMINVDQQAHT